MTDRPSAGAPADARLVPVVKSLLGGEIPEDTVFPFPEIEASERESGSWRRVILRDGHPVLLPSPARTESAGLAKGRSARIGGSVSHTSSADGVKRHEQRGSHAYYEDVIEFHEESGMAPAGRMPWR